ncbi:MULTISPECIES: alpha/beta hydrolase [unclassified Nocardioides]|uniref:alpha/beta hydrolase n=1 Tax=unclassified Nocardioides TaxID=2615069 RepID=UPI0030149E70
MPDLHLTRLDPPGASGVVLLLHGGKPTSTRPVDGRSASWRRMAALQRDLAPGYAAHGLATWLLRYSHRGWNGDGAGPVADARAALDEVRRAHGAVPVVLLGHSMGARTGSRVADDPSVRGLVALAPWFEPGDPVAALAGRHLRAAHGRADRITSARRTREFVRRAEHLAASVAFTDMGPVGHYLLRRVDAWRAFALDAVVDITGRSAGLDRK